MNHLANIIQKELRELLTPGAIMSVVVMVVLFSILGGLIGGEVDKAQTLPSIGVVGSGHGDLTIEDGGVDWNLYETLESIYGSSIPSDAEVGDYLIKLDDFDGDFDHLKDMMSQNDLVCALIVPDDFALCISEGRPATLTQFYIYEPEGMFGSISSTVVASIASMLNTSLSNELLMGPTGGNPLFYSNPIAFGGDNDCTMINGEVHSGILPSDIAGEISSQTMIIPIVIMILVTMVGSLVISSIGSEKENKTLETLLTLPIKRTTIVTGKIIAAAVVGIIYGVAYMIGMGMYMGSLTGTMGSGVNLEDLGLSLDAFDYLLVMVSLFLSISCALGLCMILGGFAKNYKSAQTMTMPLSILAMIPMFIIMFSGWYGAGPFIQGIVFAIPFSHPMMAMEALMYGDVGLVLSGIAYMMVFAVATIAITVKLYNSDILITGLNQNRTYQKRTGKK